MVTQEAENVANHPAVWMLSHVQLFATPWTRLLCPWDFPGENTGVGCHFLLQYMKVKSESEVAQLCPTLSDPMDQAPLSMGFSRQEYWSGVPLPSPLLPLSLSFLYLATSINQFLIEVLEKAMAPHSSTLAWKIPWMEEPGRLQSMGSQRVRHD